MSPAFGEIEATVNPQHSNVLSLVDLGEADLLPLFVMPFAEGGSLRNRLDREALLPVEVLPIVHRR